MRLERFVLNWRLLRLPAFFAFIFVTFYWLSQFHVIFVLGETEVHYIGETGDYVLYRKSIDNYVPGKIWKVAESSESVIFEIFDSLKNTRSFIKYDKSSKTTNFDLSSEELSFLISHGTEMLPVEEFLNRGRQRE